jgi:prepilin-type processing-associated H-X9-DG protein
VVTTSVISNGFSAKAALANGSTMAPARGKKFRSPPSFFDGHVEYSLA